MMSRTGSDSILTGVVQRYPEKTFYLSQVFNDTTNSYKLFWFLAILSLIRRTATRSLSLPGIFTEMAVIAWHPVCLYRLSLGRQDKLQEVVLQIKQESGLLPNAVPETVREFVEGSPNARKMLEFFNRYVPPRFLTPWFAQQLSGERDYTKRTHAIRTMARNSQTTPFACPYYFEGMGARGSLHLNDSWRAFLVENLGIAQAFAEHHLSVYLQARNPNVPGIVNKLEAPKVRQLAGARNFWRIVRDEFEQKGRGAEFKDIYSGRLLAESFSIDHFLPWSFVVHDLLWNLTPVETATNSSKADSLPDLDLYLPRLGKLHFAAIEVAQRQPTFLEDYTDCFKEDVAGLLTLDESGLLAKYREVILPQAQIAMNQGFQPSWRLPD